MKDSEYIQYMINCQKQKMQTAMDTVTLQNDHKLKYICTSNFKTGGQKKSIIFTFNITCLTKFLYKGNTVIFFSVQEKKSIKNYVIYSRAVNI